MFVCFCACLPVLLLVYCIMKSQCSWNILIEKFCTTDNALRECKIIKKNNSKTTLKTLNHFYFHVDLGLAGGKGNEKFIDFAEKLFNPKRKKNYIEISWRGREPKQILCTSFRYHFWGELLFNLFQRVIGFHFNLFLRLQLIRKGGEQRQTTVLTPEL